jgi:hypothetical protein
MARFNTPGHKAKAAASLATSPLATVSQKANTSTFQGAAGWTRTPQTEILLRAAGAVHGGEGTFYESAEKRDDKLRELVRWVALNDPEWGFEFARWLRGPGNMRTASLMFAVEFAHERLKEGEHGRAGTRVGEPGKKWATVSNRSIIDVVCQRADEPGELLAIWTAWYGRRIPKPVKRGLGDAVRRLYNEFSLLKYDTDSHAYRFGDVLELCHPSADPAKQAWQGELFSYAIDRRHGRGEEIPSALGMVRKNASFRSRASEAPYLAYDQQALREAGMTWEDALSLAGQLRIEKRKVWEALIPSMGIMALVRNLRNFDEEGISDESADYVIGLLKDEHVIANSRMFPFRFLSAYRAAGASLRWSYALERALNLSLANVPSLGGRTLILVDRSPSMFPESGYQYAGRNSKSDITLADQAAIFGAALALRAENPTLVEFGGASKEITVPKGGSVLRLVESFKMINYTDIPSAVKRHYAKHDRVIVITDEQTQAGYFPSNIGHYGGMHTVPINDLVPKDIPVYMWNLAGYTAAAMPSGQEARFTMGGLTDKAFLLIPQLEAGAAGTWPWETTA